MGSEIIHGLALEKSMELENNSINCIITSPPYWQLRDYGFSEQWGLEPTYNEYLEHLWSLFNVLKDKLTDDGTCWVNLGDSYNGIKTGNTYTKQHTVIRNGRVKKTRQDCKQLNTTFSRRIRYCCECGNKFDALPNQYFCSAKCSGVDNTPRKEKGVLPDKCLLLIPHRFAIGMIDRGWILRNDIIWAKPNGMPESVTDRFSKKHEFIFFFVKSKKYYFDLDSVRLKANYSGGKPTNYVTVTQTGGKKTAFSGGQGNTNKNPGDVSDFWAITTKPNSTNHYASYNSQLIDKPIIAGCPKGGMILDPFCGTGTTLVRAMQLERKGIGIEGNPEYVKIAEKNIEPYLIQNNLFKVA